MKRYLLLALLAALLAPAAQAADAPGSARYFNTDWGFSIAIPRGWFFQPSPLRLKNAPGCLNSVRGSDYLYLVVVDSRQLSPERLAQEHFKEIRASTRVTALTSEPFEAGGRTGYRLTWQTQGQEAYSGKPVVCSYVRAFMPLTAAKTLVLTGAALARTSEGSVARLPELLEIVDSLQFVEGR